MLDPGDFDLLRRDVRFLELIERSYPSSAILGPARGAGGPAAVDEDEVGRLCRVVVHLFLKAKKLPARVRHPQTNEDNLAVLGRAAVGAKPSDLLHRCLGRLLVGCGRLVSAGTIESPLFAEVLVERGHFGQRLVANRFLLFTLFEKLLNWTDVNGLLPFLWSGVRRIRWHV